MLDIFGVLLMFGVSLGETSAKDLEHGKASQASGVFFQLLAKYCVISLSNRWNNEHGGKFEHQSKMKDIMTEAY